MTVLAIIIALVALLGSIFLWLRLQRVTATLAQLDQVRASDTPKKIILRDIPTVAAPPDEIAPDDPPNRKLIILDFRDELIIFDNQSEGQFALKEVTVDIPKGTTVVIPSITGFSMLFGKLEILDPVEGHFEYDLLDHNFGLQRVNIITLEIGSTTATVQAQMILRDENGDSEWAGVMHVHLLFLGPHPE